MVGIAEQLDAPKMGVAEVTLIGTASGYGESIVIHLGNGDWVVVDCCSKPVSKECLPYEYLKSLGINIQEHLKYVICTHWHEDHIKGLAELLKVCSPETIFAISCAENRQNFVYELSTNYRYKGKSRVLNELNLTLEFVKEKGIKVKRVKQDCPVFNKGGIICWALSPSEAVVEEFDQEIANSIAKYNKALSQKEKLSQYNKDEIQNAREIEDEICADFETLLHDKLDNIIDEEESIDSLVEDLNNFRDINKEIVNDRSVALLLTIHGHHIILGADLEVDNNDIRKGWNAVLDCECMDGVSSHLFKIPHHGSDTGYHKAFLDKHIAKDATSKLTAWNSGKSPDPKPKLLKLYYNHTNSLYITTTETLKMKNTESDKTVREAMNHTTEKIQEFTPTIGLIRSRLDLSLDTDIWDTQPFGSAKKVTKDFLDQLKGNGDRFR